MKRIKMHRVITRKSSYEKLATLEEKMSDLADRYEALRNDDPAEALFHELEEANSQCSRLYNILNQHLDNRDELREAEAKLRHYEQERRRLNFPDTLNMSLADAMAFEKLINEWRKIK